MIAKQDRAEGGVMATKSNQVTREMLTDQEWQRMGQLFETIRRCKAKLQAKRGAA